MHRIIRRTAFGAAVTIGCALAGCNGTASHSEHGSKASDAHDHAHHGPHHGHLMELGDEEYHVEWTHDESGKITFYILDSEAKKEVPIAAEEISIDVKIGDRAPVNFKLPAVNPMDGKSSTFETVNKELLGVLEALKSPGIQAILKLTINGKPYEQRIEAHEHAH